MRSTLERSTTTLEHPPTIARSATRGRRRRYVSWLGGGTAGNEQLVATVGVVLIALFAVTGTTILRIHQLLDVHMFVGILLAGPVGLKLGATGYRFARYYSGDPAYRREGPPKLSLRLLAPVLVLLTLSLFLSGFVLMLEGASRSPQVMLIHEASFLLWITVAGLHVLSHPPRLGKSLRRRAQQPPHRRAGRSRAVARRIQRGRDRAGAGHRAQRALRQLTSGRTNLAASIGAVMCDCFAGETTDRRVQRAGKRAAARLECGVGDATRV